jgi:hypothetical protein
MPRRSSYHTWPSVGGTCVQRGDSSAAHSSVIASAQQWRFGSCHGAHHITRGRQWAVRACSETTVRLLHHLLSLMLGSGAFAHATALIMSHVAVSRRHVRAARLSLGCSFVGCRLCSVAVHWLTSRRSSCHTRSSVGGTCVQRGYLSVAPSPAVARAQQRRHGSRQGVHGVTSGRQVARACSEKLHITRGRQWAVRACSETTARLLRRLLSLVLSSGALAHAKSLIMSHGAVGMLHVRAARLPLGRSFVGCR